MLTLCLALGAATAATRGKHWQQQVSSWWRIMPVVFAAWWLGPWGIWALVLLIGALALRELVPLMPPASPQARMLRRSLQAAWLLQAVVAALSPALVAATAAAAAVGAWWLYRRHRQTQHLLLALFALQAAGLWCLPLLARWPASVTSAASAVSAVSALSAAPAAAWFLYVCTLTALNDIGQFVTGKLWGRHALARQISPGKTWQGALGGLVVSLSVSLLVGWQLGLTEVSGASFLLLSGLCLCVSGLAGDLLFSAGKRALGIKDYSSLIPGHGGILDRVDSLVFTAPALLLALHAAHRLNP
jgi:phosphatidate cytidylyltransferase